MTSKNIIRIGVFALMVAGTFLMGFSCGRDPYLGLSKGTVVAKVGDTKITIGDWVRQIDLYRVFSPQAIDPTNSDHLKEVLQSIVDQEIVLGAIRKEKYSDPKFDKQIKDDLEQAGTLLKQIREKLINDMDAVERLSRHYKEDYVKMRLAQNYAEAKVDAVKVTEIDLRDRYDKYVADAKRAGQKIRSLEEIKAQIKVRVQADKLLEVLQGDRKITRQEDTIQKYLGKTSPTQQILEPKTSDSK